MDNFSPVPMNGTATVVEEKVEHVVIEEKDISKGVEIIEEAIQDDEVVEEVLDNTKTPQKQNNKVEVFDFIDTEKRNVFYGSSTYGAKGSIDEIKDVEDVFAFYKREGLHEDVYLPITNVAVRIYEFSNTSISMEELADFSDKDFAFRAQINLAGTQTRQFVELIFKNAEFLTSDGAELTDIHFEQISAQDIPLLILAAAKLLDRVYTETKGTAGSKVMSWTDVCDKCGTTQSLSFDINDILRSNYTPEMITWANTNYDPLDTLENNIRRSHKLRAKGVKYKKARGGIDTIYFLKDPDWIRSFNYDELAHRHVINKFSTHRILKPVIELEYWSIMTNKEKLVQIHTFLNRPTYVEDMTREGFSRTEAEELKDNFNTELYLCRVTKYWFSSRVVDNNQKDTNGKPKELTNKDMSTVPLEKKVEMLRALDDDTLLAIIEQIEALTKFGIPQIKYEWTCGKCGEKQTTEIDPILLVFLVLQNSIKTDDKN